jgi:MFS family permease
MLLADRGLSMIDSGPYLAAMIAGSFFGYIVGAWIGDRVGRRYTLMLFSLGGIALALTYPQISASGPSFILLSFPLGFVATGMFGIISSILIELYPTELRGSGLGFCYNFGRGIAGFAPALIGTGAALLGVGYAIALLVIAAYGLVILTALFLPETQGSRLEFSKLAPRSLG